MKTNNPFPYRLYLVTDEKACLGRDFFQVVEAAVKGGVDLVQIREKELPEAAFLEKTLRLRELLDRYGVPLIVNDHLGVAQQSGVAGIHVGNSDVAPQQIREAWAGCGILGYSLEDEAHLQSPHAQLADYVALSPVFATPTKTDTITEWGLEGVRRIRNLTTKPLVAIGRVSAENATDLVTAGADCLAVVSAILSAPDPARVAEDIRNQIEKAL
ncbi:thiamine phosphate synthase [Rufibacter tibetensis]|uniref:Thiamine-phosphate synthase n=1 Tax=Rufibacter tibetensis TaxID=512763 RepID=A0A0P0D172_9BACT|nr:thiamine phosphate synthase [Rufibacter tibetensis]ALJ00787.1 thiamine-phosphate pyrophosphorylase [Rufibacter tibetensis]